jgi:hypothetical protein
MQMKFESARAGVMVLWRRPESIEGERMRRRPRLTARHDVWWPGMWEEAAWAAIALSGLIGVMVSFAM